MVQSSRFECDLSFTKVNTLFTDRLNANDVGLTKLIELIKQWVTLNTRSIILHKSKLLNFMMKYWC